MVAAPQFDPFAPLPGKFSTFDQPGKYRVNNHPTREVTGRGLHRPSAEVRKRLGWTACYVYDYLVSRRHSRDGLVFCSIDTIAKHTPKRSTDGFLPDDTHEAAVKRVKHALRRLEAAKLIEVVGWRPSGFRGNAQWAYFRRVLGRDAGGEFYMPDATIHAIDKLPQYGGARKGAGRPPKCRNQDGPSNIQDGLSPPLRTEIKLGHEVLYVRSVLKRFVFPTEKQGAEAAPLMPSARGAEDGGDGWDGDDLGLTVGPRHPLPVVRFDPPEGLVPPMPSLRPAHFPLPPRLDPAITDGDIARTLVQVYAGMVFARWKTRYFSRKAPHELPGYAGLVAAGRALIEHDIAPAAWAQFASDMWATHARPGPRGGRPKPPPLRAVFCAKTITEKRGWFRSECSTYECSLPSYTPARKDLVERWSAMSLRLSTAPDLAAVNALVERYFPDGLYSVLAASAAEEVRVEQERIDRAAAQGVWLWG